MEKVHKDFHGVLSCAIDFLESEYGLQGLYEFLSSLSGTVYAPLVDEMRKEGLPALRRHVERIFELEGGELEINEDRQKLVLNVHRCPAISHLRRRGYPIASSFCEHCRILNEAISKDAGFESDVVYEQSEGRCVQKFWRREE